MTAPVLWICSGSTRSGHDHESNKLNFVHVQPLVGQEQVLLPVTRSNSASIEILETNQAVCQAPAQVAGTKRARNEGFANGNGAVFGAVQFNGGELQSRVPCRYRPPDVARKQYTVKLPTGGVVSMMVGSCTKTSDAIDLLWYSSQLPHAVLQVRFRCCHVDSNAAETSSIVLLPLPATQCYS
jgi:hypothetical protein